MIRVLAANARRAAGEAAENLAARQVIAGTLLEHDDAWSIGRKAAWLRSKGLLGAMIWEMSGDTGTLMGALDAGLR
ncbi:hypothetical protein [Microbispora catharanthi]|uniref:GH18 domain-containing protein n=1 Tax=Microbispora catharanthi TaxID=1712871 RepID=A0A5N6BMU9_9ACTN|nr:hypothetical protein [Microbispora catharanthi]KAB8181393.1 hypothetical protein FH610_028670 [Microbispora catharanthi]